MENLQQLVLELAVELHLFHHEFDYSLQTADATIKN